MEARRTAPVKLVVPDEYHDDLHKTAEQFLYCANENSVLVTAPCPLARTAVLVEDGGLAPAIS